MDAAKDFALNVVGGNSKKEEWYDVVIRKSQYKSCPALQDVNGNTPRSQRKQSHVVAAFEQSLSNMTSRLQHLTATAEQKDSELNELRNTIESLRNKSVEAGLVSSKYLTGTSVNSVISASPHITRRHTFNNNGVDNGFKDGRLLSRQLSTDSVSSLSSACSLNSSASKQSCDLSNKKKKKGWLRSSFSKAFSRSKKNRNGSVSDVEDINMLHSDTSTPNSPLLASPHQNVPYNQRLMSNSNLSNNVKISQSSSAIYDNDEEIAPEAIQELKKQLREKDMVLTDIRLDALTSAHQLESLKDTVNKMRSEMLSLKEDNVRLQRLVTSKSLASSRSSLHRLTNDNRNNSVEYLEKKLSSSEHSALSSRDMLLIDGRSDMIDDDSTRVTISVHLGFHGDRNKILASSQTENEVLISNISISNKTKWEALDNIIRRAFKVRTIELMNCF
ncbi:NAV2 (predicted) [Pycnogonum litorale]